MLSASRNPFIWGWMWLALSTSAICFAASRVTWSGWGICPLVMRSNQYTASGASAEIASVSRSWRMR